MANPHLFHVLKLTIEFFTGKTKEIFEMRGLEIRLFLYPLFLPAGPDPAAVARSLDPGSSARSLDPGYFNHRGAGCLSAKGD